MYMQLVGAVSRDNSLRIIQVTPNPPLIDIIFLSTSHPLLYVLIIIVCCGAVLSQKDIIETVNKHPNAGWTAGHNPSLANYTVNINTLLLLSSRNNFLLCLLTSESSSCVQIEQFKHILGVKPTPPGLRAGVPTKTYSKSKELPKEFDARSKWSGCTTIGNILGKLN
jgi:hypothetical protein